MSIIYYNLTLNLENHIHIMSDLSSISHAVLLNFYWTNRLLIDGLKVKQDIPERGINLGMCLMEIWSMQNKYV